MSLTKEIKDKKVNFEFNKGFLNLFSQKIKDNDTKEYKWMHELLDLMNSSLNNSCVLNWPLNSLLWRPGLQSSFLSLPIHNEPLFLDVR